MPFRNHFSTLGEHSSSPTVNAIHRISKWHPCASSSSKENSPILKCFLSRPTRQNPSRSYLNHSIILITKAFHCLLLQKVLREEGLRGLRGFACPLNILYNKYRMLTSVLLSCPQFFLLCLGTQLSFCHWSHLELRYRYLSILCP